MTVTQPVTNTAAAVRPKHGDAQDALEDEYLEVHVCWEDVGIGPYEYGSERGNDVHYVPEVEGDGTVTLKWTAEPDLVDEGLALPFELTREDREEDLGIDYEIRAVLVTAKLSRRRHPSKAESRPLTDVEATYEWEAFPPGSACTPSWRYRT